MADVTSSTPNLCTECHRDENEFHKPWCPYANSNSVPAYAAPAMYDNDPVNHPNHYGGDTVYETIKVAEAWELDKDAYLFNVIKYVSRAGKKDDILQDLKKARFYLDRRIKNLESNA